MTKTIVIGAGLGGIALAIRLQAANIPTLILEKRPQPGGRAYVYQDQGFIFDAGPTVITDPLVLEELFNLSGKCMADYIELLRVTPFYRLCWPSGKIFNVDNNKVNIEQQIANFNPRDVDGYRRFWTYSQAVCTEGYHKLGSRTFLAFSDMLRICPLLIKFKAWRSVYSIVAKFIKDDYLRQVFSFNSLFIGGNPFTTSSIYTLIHALECKWGVWFPRGGTNALVRGLVILFKELGGEIELNAHVSKLQIVGQRIKMVYLVDGRHFNTTAVASNADVIYTYETLLGHHPHGLASAISLKRKRISYSLFVLYFGLNKQYSKLVQHTVFFGQRYKELIHDISYSNTLTDDFPLYLHAPYVTDSSLAPPGCGSYYALTPVPHLGTAPLDWTKEGPRLRERIFDYLESYWLPGLRQHLVTYRIFTPFNFRDELGAYLGSAFSIEPLLTQSAWFRPHHRDDNITNLYLVGAGTHPGAGIPGVISSAKATASLMLADLFYS